MLLKHVCPQCGHHYLADDQDASIDCPRCHAAPQAGWAPPGVPGMVDHQPHLPPDVPQGGYEDEPDPVVHTHDYGFNPLEPPPMALTSDRLVRGLVSGVVGTLLLGLVIGAALSSTGITLPAVTGLLVGLVAGYCCKWGFGARSSRRTRLRAGGVVLAAALCGFVGVTTGGWVLERSVALRAEGANQDLDRGLAGLERQRRRATDEGVAIVIDDRIAEARRLKDLSSAALEDYLWVQQAQLWPAPLAYAKLQATRRPLVQLGPDSDAVRLEPNGMLAALGGELLIAVLLGAWLVTGRGR